VHYLSIVHTEFWTKFTAAVPGIGVLHPFSVSISAAALIHFTYSNVRLQ
jgi:hypothetical protein